MDTEIPERGRVVAVDIGDVRVGVAVSDPGQVIASPHDTLAVDDPDDLDGIAGQIAAVGDDRGAVGFVVGYPRTLDAREGAAARRARLLAEALEERTGRPVQLWDERFTTVEAERVMLEQDASRAERRETLDRVAAGVILQGWLESRRQR